jgi:hypothetical protein
LIGRGRLGPTATPPSLSPCWAAKLSHMTAQSDTRYTQADDIFDLGRLGTELTARGYRTVVQTPAVQLPYLAVTNQDANVLTEKVYVQGASYWWSWAEPITGRDDVTSAANILARVLRSVSE